MRRVAEVEPQRRIETAWGVLERTSYTGRRSSVRRVESAGGKEARAALSGGGERTHHC